jgi:hypothetical protein
MLDNLNMSAGMFSPGSMSSINRREFLALGSVATVELLAGAELGIPSGAAVQDADPNGLMLLPYPQEIERTGGALRMGAVRFETVGRPSSTKDLAIDSLGRFLMGGGGKMVVRIGSVEEGYDRSWLSETESEFLSSERTSPEASVLRISPEGIVAVGKGKWGMLQASQTVVQLAIQARREGHDSIPCLRIRDWPDMRWRCLSPTLTWYSGWNRLEGYDLCNWSEGEWKWLADWSMLHKCNCWAVCMYGYWPFRLPGYEKETLDLDSPFYNPKTNEKELRRFRHRNIVREFYPEVIRYANERGIKVYAYIGENSFNGCDFKNNREIYAGGAAEMLPFAPGVDAYWDAFIGRILELGFNGFVFEDPEANHVPNQTAQCYQAFWEPWASTYGFKSVAETNRNNPPLGVHVEYYTWLFREFDQKIQKHSQRLGRQSEIYLISHILLARIIAESKNAEERKRWFQLVDEKHGKAVPFIIGEWSEPLYVEIFGKDRVASLGGRGGSCTNAMRRIASINNNWLHGGMGGDLAYERDCQKHIFEAGGFGAMGYIFEWTNTEAFGYLAAQHLWRNRGIPGVSNTNQTDILEYAYRLYYGDEVGRLVARAMDEGSDVNDAMVLEGVYGSQWPTTGRALHRDYQYLTVLADHAERLAREAYGLFTGHEPDLENATYDQDAFVWDGHDREKDKLFKTERLRLLWVSTRRSQEMCGAALAHRLAQRLIRQGAPIGAVLTQFDRAIEHARLNQFIYQLNYEDDYDWTDGLCSKVTERLQQQRTEFLAACTGGDQLLQSWDFSHSQDVLGWSAAHHMAQPTVEHGLLVSHATGGDPFIVQEQSLRLEPAGASKFIVLEMSSDKAGKVQVFWVSTGGNGPAEFSEQNSVQFSIGASSQLEKFRLPLNWQGTLTRLRVDFPDRAAVKVRSISLTETSKTALANLDMEQPVSNFARASAENPILFIPWRPLTDILPPKEKKPGRFLSTRIGLVDQDDFFRLGVVFTVETQGSNGDWNPIFRRGLMRRQRAWEQWKIPLPAAESSGTVRLRFVTDSYTRAQDRNAPSWQWALWGQPQIVRLGEDGRREVLYDFAAHLDQGRALTRLDQDGRERPFNAPGEDASGATFRLLGPNETARRLARLQEADPAVQWIGGFKGWSIGAPHQASYTSYLGEVDSHWSYGAEPEVGWTTVPVPKKAPAMAVFVGSTDFNPAHAELLCDGQVVVRFDTGITEDRSWSQNGCELRYCHMATIPNKGISGIYLLRLPDSKVTAGQALNLAMRIPAKGGGWVMCHGFPNTSAAVRQEVHSPDDRVPAIAAFTPHRDDCSGLTIGEFVVNL